MGHIIDHAMTRVVRMTLAVENTAYGIYNSLAPGRVQDWRAWRTRLLPGTELWDFSRVDPDNRRPVDYDTRRALAEFDAEMTARQRDAAAARLVEISGARRDRVFARSRTLQDQQVVVVVPRLPATRLPDASVPPLAERVWGDTPTIRAAGVFEQFRIAFLEGH